MKYELLPLGMFAFSILFVTSYDTLDTHFTVTAPLQHAVQLDYIGEYHYIPVNDTQSYIGVVSRVNAIGEDHIEVQFADNGIFVGPYRIPEFEHTQTIRKGDVFVEMCLNCDSGTSLGLLTYVGIEEYDGRDYYKFFRTSADVDKGLQCKYPQVIIESLKTDLDITIPPGKIHTIVHPLS